MPLKRGKSSQTFKMNVHEMVQSGYPIKRALAAAYRQQRASGKKKKK